MIQITKFLKLDQLVLSGKSKEGNKTLLSRMAITYIDNSINPSVDYE